MVLSPLPRFKRLTGVLLAFLLMSASIVAPRAASAQESGLRDHMLTVNGMGKVTAQPDVAWVDMGVVTEAIAASEAVAANNQSMDAVFAALEEMAVARTDVQTSQFSVQPVYSRPEGPDEAPTIRGYRVTNQVTVKIRQLSQIGFVIDRVVRLGSNRLNAVRFGIDDPEPLLDQAREQAVLDALRKAKLYVRASGVALGRIISITEAGAVVPEPRHARAFAMESAQVPIAPGEQTLTAGVVLEIEIDPDQQ